MTDRSLLISVLMIYDTAIIPLRTLVSRNFFVMRSYVKFLHDQFQFLNLEYANGKLEKIEETFIFVPSVILIERFFFNLKRLIFK